MILSINLSVCQSENTGLATSPMGFLRDLARLNTDAIKHVREPARKEASL